MTSSQPRLAQVLRRDRERAAIAAVEAFVRELDRYSSFPPEVLDGDIRGIVRHNIDLFLTSLASGRLPGAAELEVVRTSAATRAEERVPLDLVVSAYLIGARVTVQTILADEALGGVMSTDDAAFILNYLTAATSAAIGGYLDELRVIQQAAQSVRERVLDSLLSGGPLVGDPLGYDLPERFLVLAIAIGPSVDELRPDVDQAMAAHRKLRRVRAALERHCGDRHLAAVGAGGGLVLVPDHPSRPAPDQIVARLAKAADAEVIAGATITETAKTAEAARLAAEVLEVARILRRGPGAYELTDVLLEYQITRPGPACDALARLVAPLESHPELLATLQSYLASGGNRRRTARQLGVHPNTVDNRIRRVSEMIGSEVIDADPVRLRTALIARDAIHHRSAPH